MTVDRGYLFLLIYFYNENIKIDVFTYYIRRTKHQTSLEEVILCNLYSENFSFFRKCKIKSTLDVIFRLHNYNDTETRIWHTGNFNFKP